MLALGRRDLFFAWVPDKVVLKVGVDNEYRLQVVNIFSLGSLGKDVYFGTNRSHSNFGELSLEVEGEATEVPNVDRPTGSDVFVEVLHEGLPNNDVLGFGLQRLEVGGSSLGGLVVLAGVFAVASQNPRRGHGFEF